ncbi:MAG: YARHG domain-containing protein [Saprospiraceae bacterium]
MKNILYLFILASFFSNCGNEVKNKDAKVEVEQGTEISSTDQSAKEEEEIPEQPQTTTDDLLGFWVGNFAPDNGEEDKALIIDEGYIWSRTNKINISIDKIIDSKVVGHSVVAGNDRPFEGTIEKLDNPERYFFQVKEPGDNKYDGEFSFTIFIAETNLVGKWTAYKNIEIKNRKYILNPKKFTYNPDIMLEDSKRYINWNKKIEKKERMEYDDNEVEEWISNEFATATNLSYEINASNRLLTKSEVENLKKGDLTIIRNCIYARHGYSFKNRPLRVFFDAQTWYIPVHANIKNDFTEIEKQNIKLLLRYEKNAAEYYDSFGRG